MATLLEEIDEAIGWVENEYGFVADVLKKARAALAALQTPMWNPINTAPTDGTLVWVYTAAFDGLPTFQGPCSYHPDAGWCTDELRHVTHWIPLSAVYLLPPT